MQRRFVRKGSQILTLIDDGQRHKAALRAVPFSSLFFCSKPLTAALSRRRTQIFLILYGIAVGLKVAKEFSSQNESLISKHVKFSVLEIRNGVAPEVPNIGAFGILRNGRIGHMTSQIRGDNSSIVLSSAVPMEWDSWYFQTCDRSNPNCKDDDAGLDPVRFQLHVLKESSWDLVASSTQHSTALAPTTFCHGRRPPPSTRGERVVLPLFQHTVPRHLELL